MTDGQGTRDDPAGDGGAGGDRERARHLVATGRGGTLDPFVLRGDKRLVFSPDRNAVIGYRPVMGVGVAAGDPVGDPASYPAAIEAFLQLCKRERWRPAVYGADARDVDLYHDAGLRTMEIGAEAILDVGEFRLGGRRMRSVRQAVTRTRRNGVTVTTYREGKLDPDLRQDLRRMAVAHRAGRREFGFSMSLGDLLGRDHPDNLLFVATDADGRTLAFQRYVPCAGGRALSLDGMRRRRGIVNGVNELLIVETVEWAREHGVETISLNFAAFRDLFGNRQDTWRGRAAAWGIRRLEGRLGIQMDALRRFNRKFRPRWCPRVIAYPARRKLPRIGIAALSAEGMLPFDRGRRDELDS